jgi:hypothetical protein
MNIGFIKKAKVCDSCSFEYRVKNKTEQRYQMLSPMNEEKLVKHIDSS